MTPLKFAAHLALPALFWTLPAHAGGAAKDNPEDNPYAPARAIIADMQRIVTPNGVEESFAAELGGVKQWVNIRGADRGNPILLYIHGGPAAPEMPMAWSFQRPWEDFFTVAQWDQRGAGKSFPLNDPDRLVPTLTPDRYAQDAIELIGLLKKRYGKKKVIVLGHSWGSVIGMMVAKKRPDLLHAYIGAGQIINARRGEKVSYAWTLEQARKDGNRQAVAELEALAPYPAPGVFDAAAMTTERKWNIHYGGLYAHRDNADYYFKIPRLSPEYAPEDIQSWGQGSAFTITHLWPKISEIDFDGVKRLGLPVFMFVGRDDYTTPAPLIANWFKQLKAPQKRLIWFENSAHLMMNSEPGKMLLALLGTARPLAVQAGDGAPLEFK